MKDLQETTFDIINDAEWHASTSSGVLQQIFYRIQRMYL